MGTLVGDGTFDGVGGGEGGGGGEPATSAVWTTRRITTGGEQAVSVDDVVLSVVSPDSAVVVRLPAVADSDGRQLWIKRWLSAHLVSVDAQVGETLEDGAPIELDVNKAAVHLGCDGVVWMVLP